MICFVCAIPLTVYAKLAWLPSANANVAVPTSCACTSAGLNGTALNGLFRYYGDIDGDGDVDGTDLFAYVPTVFNAGNYNPAFDFDGDGDGDGTELFEFVQNLFTPLP